VQSETERFDEGARVDGDVEYVIQSCCKYIVVELLICKSFTVMLKNLILGKLMKLLKITSKTISKR